MQSEGWTHPPEALMGTPWIRGDTALGDVVRWFSATVEENLASPLWRERYAPLVAAEQAAAAGEKHPFLTVVMRTQLTREDALTEALLSLMAQSDPDFEVVLIPHRVTGETRARVEAIVAGFPADFAGRVRVLPLEEGNRTAPLNYGFARSRGDYIAVLDDDDVVMEHWVEEFHRAAEAHPGTVAHCQAVNQDWRSQTDRTGQKALAAMSAPRAVYCQPFSAFVELRVNRCPVFTLAFPAWAFRELGFLFDEALTTTEDWDYLRRVTAVCGVTDIPRVGGIYRLWQSGTTSHTQHREKEWQRNERYINREERRYPVILRRSQHREAEHLGRLVELGIRDEEETRRLERSSGTIEDLQSIIAAQKETIFALEGKGFRGRFLRMLKLVWHRLRGK
ncbi:MAG: glycosyltransferase family 2 protein [Clostridia bacterium]|nr:glycosyltransferase family 2 protein [Clostridia bacterium]